MRFNIIMFFVAPYLRLKPYMNKKLYHNQNVFNKKIEYYNFNNNITFNNSIFLKNKIILYQNYTITIKKLFEEEEYLLNFYNNTFFNDLFIIKYCNRQFIVHKFLGVLIDSIKINLEFKDDNLVFVNFGLDSNNNLTIKDTNNLIILGNIYIIKINLK
jgi:hypothetical protein